MFCYKASCWTLPDCRDQGCRARLRRWVQYTLLTVTESSKLSVPLPLYLAIRTTLGPMGRTIEDLELCMKVVADASVALSASHHGLLPMPYRETVLPKKLRIGYFVEGEHTPTNTVDLITV